MIKRYWLRLLGGLLLFGAVVAVAVYLVYAKFGPSLSSEDVQTLIQNWMEQNLPKKAP